MRPLALLAVAACQLDVASQESHDGAPTGLFVDDGGASDGAGPSGDDLAVVVAPPDADRADLPPPSGVVDLAGADLTPPPPTVLTQHNDPQRTGANLRETALTPANVSVGTFGKRFERAVDGYLYAQPLVAPVAGRNVVFLATEHDSVYAYDADDPAASAPLWQVNLGPPAPSSDYNCTDLIPEDGITSTPVIDPATQTIYVSAKTKEAGVHHQRLHALDLTSGAEKFGGPVEIAARVPGTGDGSDGTTIAFQAQLQLQRPSLLLSRGQIYLAFGSHCDTGDYHGWMMAYDAATLQQTAAWIVTPDGGQGSIWQSGQGPTADERGELYVVTSNGTTITDGSELSEAFVKLSPSLAVDDWFIPYNYDQLNLLDLDLGSAGVLLAPGTHLAISGGKEGVLYLLDRDYLGRFHGGSDAQIVEHVKIAVDNIHGSPVYWRSPTDAFLYVWPENTNLLQLRFAGGVLEPAPFAQSPTPAPTGMPGGILSVSADGASGGIVWVNMVLDGDANPGTRPGVVRAFDASDVSRELWNSEEDPRDSLGNFAKFVSPTVVNGKLYMATFSNKLVVYGLLP
jgi:hypothetical protein